MPPGSPESLPATTVLNDNIYLSIEQQNAARRTVAQMAVRRGWTREEVAFYLEALGLKEAPPRTRKKRVR